MFTIDIDIAPPPINVQAGGDDFNAYRLYAFGGYFYLPKGFLNLLTYEKSTEIFQEATNELHSIKNIYLYNNNIYVGPCIKLNTVKDKWHINTYAKTSGDLAHKIIKIFEDFLKNKMMEINIETGISNAKIEEINSLIQFDEIVIAEIVNPEVKKQIIEDYF